MFSSNFYEHKVQNVTSALLRDHWLFSFKMSVHIRGIGLCTAHRLGGSAPHRSGFGALFV